VSSQRYNLPHNLFRVDADGFAAHLRRAEELDGADALAEYQHAFGLYREDFLAKETYGWADSLRADYQTRFVVAAHRAAKLALDCREVQQAAECYRAILVREVLDEEAVRGLMRCYAKLGDLNGVRKV
jgi:two-component SAPR family response regulator